MVLASSVVVRAAARKLSAFRLFHQLVIGKLTLLLRRRYFIVGLALPAVVGLDNKFI